MSITAADFMLRLLQEIDTAELRDICSEDEWVRHQRHIYWRIKKRLDSEIPLQSLLEQASEDEFVAIQKGEGK